MAEQSEWREWRETDSFGLAERQPIRCFANSSRPMLLAAGGETGLIDLWQIKRVSDPFYRDLGQVLRPERLHTWAGHSKSVSSLAFHNPSELLISGSVDGLLKFWRARRGELVAAVNLQAPIHMARAFPARNAVIVGTADTALLMIEVPTGKVLARFQVASHAGYGSASVFADERFVAGGCRDGFTCVWDVKSGKLIQQLEGMLCAFRPNANLLVTADADAFAYSYANNLYVWHLREKWLRVTVEQSEVLQFEGEHITDIAFSGDGKLLTVLTRDGHDRHIHIFRVSDWAKLQVITVNDNITALLFSPAWYEILAGLDNGRIDVWQCM